MRNVDNYYKIRFKNNELIERNQIWKTLCFSFFQKYISETDIVLDIGSGFCEFLNNIKCFKKIAIDINPRTKKLANKDIEVLQINALKIPSKYYGKVDIIFMSNFLEHLNSKEEVIKLLSICNKVLKKEGKLLLVQPNINLVKESYWDFIDHIIPLNTNSIKEALEIAGFKIEEFVEKFLPYTTKNKLLPKNEILIKLYLMMPSVIRIFAGQSFVLAIKNHNN